MLYTQLLIVAQLVSSKNSVKNTCY